MSLPKKKIGILLLINGIHHYFEDIFSYYVDFSLGVKGLVQNLILLMNPYSLIALVLSVFLFLKVRRHFGYLLEDFYLRFYYTQTLCTSDFSRFLNF